MITRRLPGQLPLKVPSLAAGGDERWRVGGLCAGLAAITLAVFGQTLRHPFADFDDNEYVYDNPVVARGVTFKGIIWAFTQFHAFNWHPLTWLSHMLDCQLYGLHAGGHHLTNILLHTATVILLFLILRQMTGALWRSAFVAAVFAIHPLRVESVAWVSERKDMLSGLFFMLTISAYARYARGPWSAARYGLVMLLFALGLMCKPMLVTLPLVLLLLDYWPLGRSAKRGARSAESGREQDKVQPSGWGQLLLEKIPLLALCATAGVVTLLAQNEAIQSSRSYPLPLRLGNALVTCTCYLGQMVWPAGLAPFYPYPHSRTPTWEVTLAGLLLTGLSAFAWGQRRTQPWLLVGWLWYLVMLLPVVRIIQVGIQLHADRYTYLPQIGIYVALTWLAAEWGAKWRAGRVVFGGLMAAALAALMVCAWKQTAYWRDSEALWNHTLACTTDNAVAHYNFGFALFNKGRLDEAITHFQKALEIEPDYAAAHYNLGSAFYRKGQVDEAMSQYQEALRLKPDDPDAHNNLGTTFSAKGQTDEAIRQFQEAMALKPDFAEACYNLGNALAGKGQMDEAIRQFQEALRLKPDYADAHDNLGNALGLQGRMDEAIRHYAETIRLRPNDAEARNNLGNALARTGQSDDAIRQYQEALRLKPDYAKARNNLGLALERKGQIGEAIRQYQEALRQEPDYAEAHNNLGIAFAKEGQIGEAIRQFQEALRLKPDYAEARNNLARALGMKSAPAGR